MVHLAATRSQLVELVPVVHALAERGYAGAVFNPAAGLLHVPTADVPATRGFAAPAGDDIGAEALMAATEEALDRLRPVAVLSAGTSDPALLGALAASAMGIPVLRVGAGLRSGDWTARDEIARVTLDALADQLFTDDADQTLALLSEGVPADRIVEAGSTLADAVLRWREAALPKQAWRSLRLGVGRYVLVTVQREEHLARAHALADGLEELARHEQVGLLLHPQTENALDAAGRLAALRAAGIVATPPLDYLEHLSLLLGAGAVVTDSSTTMLETSVLDVPCFTLGLVTERAATLTHGTNTLLGDDPASLGAVRRGARRGARSTPAAWDGRAGRRIADALITRLGG